MPSLDEWCTKQKLPRTESITSEKAGGLEKDLGFHAPPDGFPDWFRTGELYHKSKSGAMGAFRFLPSIT